jgi:hypothetical protein
MDTCTFFSAVTADQVTAAAAMAGVFVALWTSYKTVTQAKIATAYQLVTQFEAQWDSSILRVRRLEAATALLADPKNRGADSVIDFFETIAVAVKDRVVPLELCWHLFSDRMFGYSQAAKTRIEHVRGEDPTFWNAFVEVVSDLRHFTLARGGANPDLSARDIELFLRGEQADAEPRYR